MISIYVSSYCWNTYSFTLTLLEYLELRRVPSVELCNFSNLCFYNQLQSAIAPLLYSHIKSSTSINFIPTYNENALMQLMKKIYFCHFKYSPQCAVWSPSLLQSVIPDLTSNIMWSYYHSCPGPLGFQIPKLFKIT